MFPSEWYFGKMVSCPTPRLCSCSLGDLEAPGRGGGIRKQTSQKPVQTQSMQVGGANTRIKCKHWTIAPKRLRLPLIPRTPGSERHRVLPSTVSVIPLRARHLPALLCASTCPSAAPASKARGQGRHSLLKNQGARTSDHIWVHELWASQGAP